MLLRSAIARLGQAAFIVACLALPAAAERIDVSTDEADLQAVLDRAADGDVVALRSGEHRGQLRIARRLTLEGEAGAVVLGPGKGNVI
ncbi:MAG: nitrous oxide reductase family maturation protein NosD, partial [Microvirga sp.]